ncbi:MAG: dihydrodipicolinate synthase family protein [Bacteroidales bacterium]|jgi:4-hydroxy-tetrahydrodipicolinate synthase
METSHKEYIPVMLTPFKENGEIDFDRLSELTEFYIRAGASGLFSNCLSSEMFELTPEERIRLVRHVVTVTGKAVPVVASGTFGGKMGEQADFVKRIFDTGVEAVIVLSNMICRVNDPDEVFNENMFRLMSLTDGIPLGFYECPDPWKRLISPAQLKLFAGTKRIIYHKDTCLDIGQVRLKLKALEGSGLGLYDAYMVHAVESLRSGSSGLSCIQGNYFPELIVWLCENVNNDALAAEVDMVQQFISDRMDVMHDVYPVTAKYYLQKRGLHLTTFTRKEAGVFDDEIKKKMDQLSEDHKKLVSELQIT